MLEAYIETIHDLQAERDALRAERAAIIEDYQDRLAHAFVDIGALVMEHDALREEVALVAGVLGAVMRERDDLREELAALRAIAQAALDKGGDLELVYAPLYQQALEDIASEPQDE